MIKTDPYKLGFAEALIKYTGKKQKSNLKLRKRKLRVVEITMFKLYTPFVRRKIL